MSRQVAMLVAEWIIDQECQPDQSILAKHTWVSQPGKPVMGARLPCIVKAFDKYRELLSVIGSEYSLNWRDRYEQSLVDTFCIEFYTIPGLVYGLTLHQREFIYDAIYELSWTNVCAQETLDELTALVRQAELIKV